MGTPILSKQFSIVLDSSTLGCATDFSLTVDKDLIEISCLDATSKQSMPDLYSWKVDFSGMVLRTATVDSGKASVETLMNLILSDASVACHLLPDVSANAYYTGAGYIQNVSISGGTGSPVTFSASVTGSGPLTATATA